MNEADPGHRWGLGILRRPVTGVYCAGVAGHNWSKASICAERRAWSAVAAGDARSRSKVGIIAFMRKRKTGSATGFGAKPQGSSRPGQAEAIRRRPRKHER